MRETFVIGCLTAFYLKGGRILAILGMNRGNDVHQSMGLI
jgi:hypothetical protein